MIIYTKENSVGVPLSTKIYFRCVKFFLQEDYIISILRKMQIKYIQETKKL